MDKQKFIRYCNAEIDRMLIELRDLEEEDCESDLGGKIDGIASILDDVENGKFDGWTG